MNYRNGHIQIAIIADGGKDEFNRPLPAIETWTNPIRCHIQTITHRNDGQTTDGVWTNSSYKVWFGTHTLSETVLELFQEENQNQVQRIKVIQDKVSKGEWQVQNILIKHTMGRIELLIGNRINRQV